MLHYNLEARKFFAGTQNGRCTQGGTMHETSFVKCMAFYNWTLLYKFILAKKSISLCWGFYVPVVKDRLQLSKQEFELELNQKIINWKKRKEKFCFQISVSEHYNICYSRMKLKRKLLWFSVQVHYLIQSLSPMHFWHKFAMHLQINTTLVPLKYGNTTVALFYICIWS